MIRQRAVVDFFRVCLPGWITGIGFITYCFAMLTLCREASMLSAVIVSPFISFFLAIMALLASAGVKVALIGTFKPEIKPLWSSYVWFTELVNGVYELVAAHVIGGVLGTPFAAPCLRLFGCKVGRWVFLNTTLFSEYDLVEIGDYSALNLGATVQTHLFEDRVMKSDKLVVRDGCSIGNMAVVLYSTVMESGSVLGASSVLMKGETLAPGSHAIGIPAAPAAAPRLRGVPQNWAPAVQGAGQTWKRKVVQAAAHFLF